MQALAQVPFCRKALEILYKSEMVNKLNSHTGLYYSIVEVPQYKTISYSTIAFLLLALLETCLFCMERVLQQDCGGTADVWPISSASVKNGTPQFLCWKQHFTVNREAAGRSKILTKTIPQRLGGGGGI